mmetsp:Transcript_22828/g.35141  ORF Transcript_22828/g.35141 Transcript_22828/m.35141 type:complete len:99 (-) Transcript_22828:138-434(-)
MVVDTFLEARLAESIRTIESSRFAKAQEVGDMRRASPMYSSIFISEFMRDYERDYPLSHRIAMERRRRAVITRNNKLEWTTSQFGKMTQSIENSIEEA